MVELNLIAEYFGIDFITVTSTAAVIMLMVGFLKEFIPKMKGNITQLITLVLCLAASIATYSNGTIVTISVATIIMFAETVGGYKLIKKAGGK